MNISMGGKFFTSHAKKKKIETKKKKFDIDVFNKYFVSHYVDRQWPGIGGRGCKRQWRAPTFLLLFSLLHA